MHLRRERRLLDSLPLPHPPNFQEIPLKKGKSLVVCKGGAELLVHRVWDDRNLRGVLRLLLGQRFNLQFSHHKSNLSVDLRK